MIRNEVLTNKRGEILPIAASYGAQNLRVFSSAARSEADEKRDVNILVKLEPGRSLLDIIAIK